MKSIGKKPVIIACAALVTVGAILVYAYETPATSPAASQSAQGETGSASAAQDSAKEHVQPKTSPAPAASESAPAAPPLPGGEQASGTANYDVAALPRPVQRMLEKILTAAQSGDVEAMRPVLESNEIKPLVQPGATTDPIAYWKEHSADGSGRDYLAALLNVFASGYAETGEDGQKMYVWPHFAKRDLKSLSPQEQVDLYRIVSPEKAAEMMKSGKYAYFHAGISETGVWQYFME